MSKKESNVTQIEKTAPTPLVTTQTRADIQGAEATDFKIPFAGLNAGSGEEQEKFPNVKRGEIYSKLFGTKIEDPTFGIVRAWKDWVKYDDDDNLVYQTTDINEVPAADREWSDAPNGDRIPPAATARLNFIMVFKELPVPHVFTFKKTSYTAGMNLLTLFNAMPQYCFRFGENRKGEGKKGVYLIPTITHTGEKINAEMQAIIDSIRSSDNVQVEADGDDLPI